MQSYNNDGLQRVGDTQDSLNDEGREIAASPPANVEGIDTPILIFLYANGSCTSFLEL